MALTEHVLIFVGVLGIVTGAGAFVDFGDVVTRILLLLVSSVTWFVFGMSAFNVLVDPATTTHEPMESVAYLGLGIGAVFGLLTLYEVLMYFYEESTRASLEDVTP